MTTATAATAARRAVEDVIAGRALRAFYIAVLAVALVGSTQGVKGWIGWPTPFAFGAVLLAELGGVALAIFSDRRRQKGERALAARTLSAAFAAGAIAVQIRGHADPAGDITDVGLFFAGFSAAGYVIYLLDSAAKRRDALRDQGKLADTPPNYGAYQWIRHPWLTRRARALAVANAEARLVERITSREQGGPDRPTTPLLGRAASLAAAVAQVAAERRAAAIRTSLRTRIAAGVDPQMAKIAVHTYDLARVAQGIADGADYPALTGLLAAELTPTRIAAGITARRSRRWYRWGKPSVQTNQIVAALTAAPAPETEETAPETEETAPAPAAPTRPDVVPAGARLLRIRCARAAAAAPTPAPIVVPAPPAPRTQETVQTAPETVETDPAGDRVDQLDAAGDDQVDDPAPAPADKAPTLPAVDPAVLPHLAKVMAAHDDWAAGINMPSRHPHALTYAKIKAAAGINGQQTAADIRTALLSLCHAPEAARAYVDAHAPATSAA